MHRAVQFVAAELDEGVSEIYDGTAGLGWNVFPFAGVGFQGLEPA
jgi:hypothetical protein